MNYNTNQSIFIQITDRICDWVLNREYLADSRIPSVREMLGSAQKRALLQVLM